jgi:hypothetical protein
MICLSPKVYPCRLEGPRPQASVLAFVLRTGIEPAKIRGENPNCIPAYTGACALSGHYSDIHCRFVPSSITIPVESVIIIDFNCIWVSLERHHTIAFVISIIIALPLFRNKKLSAILAYFSVISHLPITRTATGNRTPAYGLRIHRTSRYTMAACWQLLGGCLTLLLLCLYLSKPVWVCQASLWSIFHREDWLTTRVRLFSVNTSGNYTIKRRRTELLNKRR